MSVEIVFPPSLFASSEKKKIPDFCLKQASFVSN